MASDTQQKPGETHYPHRTSMAIYLSVCCHIPIFGSIKGIAVIPFRVKSVGLLIAVIEMTLNVSTYCCDTARWNDDNAKGYSEESVNEIV